jgi:hypothetical protein
MTHPGDIFDRFVPDRAPSPDSSDFKSKQSSQPVKRLDFKTPPARALGLSRTEGRSDGIFGMDSYLHLGLFKQ